MNNVFLDDNSKIRFGAIKRKNKIKYRKKDIIIAPLEPIIRILKNVIEIGDIRTSFNNLFFEINTTQIAIGNFIKIENAAIF